MEILAYAFVGLIGGAHSSFWGAYKDSVYEEFRIMKMVRSWVAGIIISIVLVYVLRWSQVANPNTGVFLALVIIYERLYTEVWKAFLREEDQKKYKIPSKVHVLGRVIERNCGRYVIGMLFLGYIAFSIFLPAIFPITVGSSSFKGIFWGIIAGFLGVAIPGALKDAPVEGFFPIKFFRSIIVGAFWGVIFSFYTENYVLLASASVGAERMTVELYKTFWLKTTPGKFKKNNIVFREWAKKRNVFIIPYAFTWLAFLFLLFKN